MKSILYILNILKYISWVVGVTTMMAYMLCRFFDIQLADRFFLIFMNMAVSGIIIAIPISGLYVYLQKLHKSQ